MLISFTVGPNALMLRGCDEAKKTDIVKTLGRSWIKVGLLVSHRTLDGSCAISEQAEHLPQQVKKEWITLMAAAAKRSRVIETNVCVNGDSPAVVKNKLCKLVELLYVAQEDAEQYGIPPGKTSVADNSGSEICRFDCNGSSSVLQAALDSCSGTIKQGAKTSEVWRVYLRPLAENKAAMTVVDRYAVKSEGGLCRFISEVNALQGDKYLTIFGSKCSASSETLTRVVRELLKRLSAGSLTEVTLYLAEDSVFQREAHHRFVHFGNDCCFQCDTGLEVLEGQQVYRSAPYKFCDPDVALVGCESKLRQHPGTTRTVFRRGSGLPQLDSRKSGTSTSR